MGGGGEGGGRGSKTGGFQAEHWMCMSSVCTLGRAANRCFKGMEKCRSSCLAGVKLPTLFYHGVACKHLYLESGLGQHSTYISIIYNSYYYFIPSNYPQTHQTTNTCWHCCVMECPLIIGVGVQIKTGVVMSAIRSGKDRDATMALVNRFITARQQDGPMTTMHHARSVPSRALLFGPLPLGVRPEYLDPEAIAPQNSLLSMQPIRICHATRSIRHPRA